MTLTLERESMKKLVQHVDLGLEKLLEESAMRGRVGLICNQASVDHGYQHAADLLHQHPGIELRALFGPQHGIRGDVQDNMIETAHGVDRKTGLPVHSLYSETREPTDAMLQDIDVLIFDMQDVGCRIYTFVYTLANCMRAARRLGKRVVVCDRPNPINGLGVAGNILEPEYASFVGQFPLPTRHGMTVGELARMFNEHFKIECDLEVVTWDGLVIGGRGELRVRPRRQVVGVDVVDPGSRRVDRRRKVVGEGRVALLELLDRLDLATGLRQAAEVPRGDRHRPFDVLCRALHQRLAGRRHVRGIGRERRAIPVGVVAEPGAAGDLAALRLDVLEIVEADLVDLLRIHLERRPGPDLRPVQAVAVRGGP